MSISAVNEVLNYLDHSVVISDGTAVINDEARLKATIHRLAEISALETGARQTLQSATAPSLRDTRGGGSRLPSSNW